MKDYVIIDGRPVPRLQPAEYGEWLVGPPPMEALKVRLWRAENALLSASMGVMEPMQQYMQDYREPVERPSDQPNEKP